MNTLLEIKNLNLFFNRKVQALCQVDLSLNEGEILGIVGESGCGKSLTNLAIMGLLPSTASVQWDHFFWNHQVYNQFDEKKWRLLRGKEIGMIFQNPMSSLNPTLNIEYQLAEILKLHRPDLTSQQRRKESIQLLGLVGIPDPEMRLKAYPFELSGGMAQRVMIATVMASQPKLLIADEPTTALDVTIQNQVLQLIKDLSQEKKMAVIFVTHDLAVVSHMSNRLNIMYAGQIIESGKTQEIITNPQHPYTQALIESLPHKSEDSPNRSRLKTIEGMVPHLTDRPLGCTFAPRCSYKRQECTDENLSFSHQNIKCLYPLHSGEAL
jgi:dipeptide transport system ATP-binding protein